MNSYDIAGYNYMAEMWCEYCVAEQIAIEEGWADCPSLVVAANRLGVDAMDEHSYDSDEFPKVVFADQTQEGDHCTYCNFPLH
jgi:hypothetical protein